MDLYWVLRIADLLLEFNEIRIFIYNFLEILCLILEKDDGFMLRRLIRVNVGV